MRKGGKRGSRLDKKLCLLVLVRVRLWLIFSESFEAK